MSWVSYQNDGKFENCVDVPLWVSTRSSRRNDSASSYADMSNPAPFGVTADEISSLSYKEDAGKESWKNLIVSADSVAYGDLEVRIA